MLQPLRNSQCIPPFFWRLPVENKHFLRAYVLSCLSAICPLELVSQGGFLIAECCGRFSVRYWTCCCIWFAWLLALFFHKALHPCSPSLLCFFQCPVLPWILFFPSTPSMSPSALPWAPSSALSSWVIVSVPDASSALSTHSLPALLPAHASPRVPHARSHLPVEHPQGAGLCRQTRLVQSGAPRLPQTHHFPGISSSLRLHHSPVCLKPETLGSSGPAPSIRTLRVDRRAL